MAKAKKLTNILHTILKKCVILQRKTVRDVAQPGSALRSGRRGRKFESCHPDFVKASLSFRLVFLMRGFSAALRHCEKERQSNPSQELFIWTASCLAVTRSDDESETNKV